MPYTVRTFYAIFYPLFHCFFQGLPFIFVLPNCGEEGAVACQGFATPDYRFVVALVDVVHLYCESPGWVFLGQAQNRWVFEGVREL
jgi:hypothetical protein